MIVENRLVSNYLAATPYGSFELKQELQFRAENAIKKGELSELCGEAVLFKPDDFSCEKCSKEMMLNFIHGIGFDNFIYRIIEDNFLRERLAGRFVSITIEEAVRNRIKKAIDLGDIDKIARPFSANYYDRGSRVCSFDRDSMVEKLKKCGVWDYIQYQVWLCQKKKEKDALSV